MPPRRIAPMMIAPARTGNIPQAQGTGAQQKETARRNTMIDKYTKIAKLEGNFYKDGGTPKKKKTKKKTKKKRKKTTCGEGYYKVKSHCRKKPKGRTPAPSKTKKAASSKLMWSS